LTSNSIAIAQMIQTPFEIRIQIQIQKQIRDIDDIDDIDDIRDIYDI
jgi:hypothetical protein